MDNTYPEDYFLLQRQIAGRMTDEYLMQSAIVSNPHKEESDQKEFIESLMQQRKRYRSEPLAPVETDFAAIDALKESMQKQSIFIKAKVQ